MHRGEPPSAREDEAPWGDVPADVAEQLVRAIDRSPSTVVSLVDADLTTRWVSRSAKRLTGIDPSARSGRPSLERVHPEDVERLLHGLAQLRTVKATNTPSVPVLEPIRYRWRLLDGTWATIEALVQNMLDDPDVNGLVLVNRPVDGQFGGVGHVVDLLVDDVPLPEVLAGCAGLVSDFVASAAVVGLVGGTPAVGAPRGTPAARLSADDRWWRATLADGRAREPVDFAGFPEDLAEQARAEGFCTARLAPLVDTSTGDVIGCVVLWMRLTIAPGVLVDGFAQAERLATLVIGEHRRQHSLRREAATDPLTGVGNRSALRRRLDAARGPITVALIDLDDFKRVNDTHGHGAGDAVLQAVAERLVDTAGDGQVVARFGGDEFAVVFVEGTPGDAAAGATQRMVDAIRVPIGVGGGCTLAVDASVGLATAAPGEVISQADTALYRAKKAPGER